MQRGRDQAISDAAKQADQVQDLYAQLDQAKSDAAKQADQMWGLNAQLVGRLTKQADQISQRQRLVLELQTQLTNKNEDLEDVESEPHRMESHALRYRFENDELKERLAHSQSNADATAAVSGGVEEEEDAEAGEDDEVDAGPFEDREFLEQLIRMSKSL